MEHRTINANTLVNIQQFLPVPMCHILFHHFISCVIDQMIWFYLFNVDVTQMLRHDYPLVEDLFPSELPPHLQSKHNVGHLCNHDPK